MIQRTQCPICKRAANPIFARPYSIPRLQNMVRASGLGDRIANSTYEIRECSPCQLHFQTLVMSDSELESWYSPPKDDAAFLKEIGEQRLHWFAHQTEEILVLRQVCGSRVPRVLDFGCNWGKWSSMALAHGCEVFAVDVNRDAARFCASRGIRMISMQDVVSLQFDFINVDQVMEHLTAPLEIAQALVRALKPGGLMKLSTPCNKQLPVRLARSTHSGDDSLLDEKTLDSLFPLMHVNLFTPHALRALARAADLEEFKQPLWTWLGAGQLWNVPRQLNRNLLTPWKRWMGRGTYLWFAKKSS